MMFSAITASSLSFLGLLATVLQGVSEPRTPSVLPVPPDQGLRSFPLAARNHQPQSTDGPLKITVLYDNLPFSADLTTNWGFAALLEFRGQTILFDTGGDGPTFMGNLDALEIDPDQIDAVVLSHAHGDHTLGLEALLERGARPVVFVLPSFPSEFKEAVGKLTEVQEVSPGQRLAEGFFTTGEVDGPVREQALVVDTELGLVVVTGCAHPGVHRLVERAHELVDRPVHLVMGGFHLGSAQPQRVEEIIGELQRLGVQKVAPSHCTGEAAIELFRQSFQEDFLSSGVGKVTTVGG
jgi:7,8-dihydropterin-6-yl-methyl-4-(beta-D-ribofuranosyl)aminobenzene 5'-phosphate synthase